MPGTLAREVEPCLHRTRTTRQVVFERFSVVWPPAVADRL
jgi:hypothetical protein